MKINKEKIESLNPCSDSLNWYLENGTEDLLETLMLLNKHRPDWARWLYIRLMNLNQRRRIAIFAAEKVLPIFEAKYPNDLRPRKAIAAVNLVLEDDTPENRRAAAAAYSDADAAATAAYAAYAADAADAAYAAYAAYAADAAYAAYAAAYDADAAAAYADAAAYAADAADAYADAAAYSANAKIKMQELLILEAVRILDEV